ncbi:unnamed protein product, partial [Natator depressus]
IFGTYSLDVVASISFSVNIDSMNNPNDPLVAYIKKYLSFNFFNPLLLSVVMFPFLTPVLDKMNVSLFPSGFLDFSSTLSSASRRSGRRTTTRNL